MKMEFLRRDSNRYKRLKKKWKRPTGRHNKMRLKRKCYPKTVSIGYSRGGKEKPHFARNINDLLKHNGIKTVILLKVGKRKKIEIAKLVKEKKIKIKNLNAEKFLKKHEKTPKKSEPAKKENKAKKLKNES